MKTYGHMVRQQYRAWSVYTDIYNQNKYLQDKRHYYYDYIKCALYVCYVSIRAQI